VVCEIVQSKNFLTFGNKTKLNELKILLIVGEGGVELGQIIAQ
jgi:hypothetical protein